MEPQPYLSRPTEVLASEPLAPDNRDEIWKWVSSKGGWARVMPDGYTTGLVLRTVSGAEVEVRYGERVLQNPDNARPDFWSCDPAVFDIKYESA